MPSAASAAAASVASPSSEDVAEIGHDGSQLVIGEVATNSGPSDCERLRGSGWPDGSHVEIVIVSLGGPRMPHTATAVGFLCLNALLTLTHSVLYRLLASALLFFHPCEITTRSVMLG